MDFVINWQRLQTHNIDNNYPKNIPITLFGNYLYYTQIIIFKKFEHF